jgi:hypothetical protein
MTTKVGMWFYWQYKFTQVFFAVLSSFSFANHAKETKNHHG